MPVLTKESLVFLQCEKTGYLECYIASWIWRVFPFILLVVGIVGNIINVAVLCRKQLRKRSTCVYLIFLALTDSTVLCFGPFVEILRSVFGIFFYSSFAVFCIFTEWIIYTAGMTSCWIIVLVTMERAFVTLFPVKAKSKMTSRNALIASITVLISIALHNGHLLYGYTLTEVKVDITEMNGTKVTYEKTCSLRAGQYTKFYNNVWSIILFVNSSLLPIILIVTGNAIVVVSLLKRRRDLRRLQAEGNNIACITDQQSRNDFNKKMFFILSAVFIGTTVPYGIYFVFLEYNKEICGQTLAKYQLASVLMKCLVWSNFSFNFLLYFMTGSLFRKECQILFGSISSYIQSLIRRNSVRPL